MSFMKEMFIAYKTRNCPGWEEFSASLTPENAYTKLVEYNDRSDVKEWLYHSFEDKKISWLINSFDFASRIVSKDHVLDMAEYLNQSEVFNSIARYAYSSGTMRRILDKLFENCEPAQRPRLLTILESKGHMQNMIKEGTIRHDAAAHFYLNEVIEGLSTTDAKIVLSHSPSFQLAKHDSHFSITTMKKYPEYKELL